MPTLDQVCALLKTEVTNVLNASGQTFPPLQVLVGWPYGQSLSEILGQAQAQVTVFPLSKASQNRTSRKPQWQTSVQPAVPLIATIAGLTTTWTITFSGSVIPGLNVHTFPDNHVADAYFQTASGDGLPAAATKTRDAINALAIGGISATASGNVVTVTGCPTLRCNIGGKATMIQEVRRTMTPVQISVWAAKGPVRNQLGAILEAGLAPSYPSPFITAPDGTQVWVRWRNSPQWNDDVQLSYSLYVWHCVLECEYATTQSTDATTVESVGTTVGTAPTSYTGGS